MIAHTPGMGEQAEREILIGDLHGIKQLRRVAGLLATLHEVGCDRDKAANRELHFDDYVLLILLYLFNPMIDSMRTLQKVAELPEVQRRLGIKHFSLGSFSESCRVFKPELLQGVVDQLAGGLLPIERDALFRSLPGKLTLVDSSVIQTLCTVAEAIFLPLGDGRHSHAWRLHLQFDVDHHVPAAWEITTPKNTAKSDEKSVLRRNLAAGHTYVMDRWYAQFTLWNDVKQAASSYVCRVRDNSVYDVIADNPLDQQAIEAGVISDQVVNIGLSKKPHERADHPTRLICVACSPHRRRGKGAQARRRRPDRPDQRRHAADRHRPAGRAGARDRVPVRVPLDDRGVLPLPQAGARLPAPAELAAGGRANPGIRGGDLLPDAQHAERPQADQVARDADGPVPAGTG
jgi:hypothetical protein